MNASSQHYQRAILAHNKNPQHFEVLEGAQRVCEGKNRLCGDAYTVYLNMKDDVLEEVSFYGYGCAISKASGSMMVSMARGKTVQEVKELYGKFTEMFSPDAGSPDESLGELSYFEGLRQTASRQKCATLAWSALIGALDGESETTTEKKEA